MSKYLIPARKITSDLSGIRNAPMYLPSRGKQALKGLGTVKWKADVIRGLDNANVDQIVFRVELVEATDEQVALLEAQPKVIKL